MSVISIRLNSDEETLLKKIVFEKLEEEYDLKLTENAYKVHIESNQKYNL